MRQHPGRHGKSHLDYCGREHRLRTPGSQWLPGMQDDDPVSVLRSQVEVVHDSQNTGPLARKALGEREGAVLMGQIKTRRGLVE